jgi:eukaryotic-like serine/threonine-protein kinase
MVRGGYQPHYVPTGHLLYMHEGTLFAAPFSPDRLEMTAQAVPVLEDVTSASISGGSQFAFSDSGALVYSSGGSVNSKNSLVWVDRKGAAQAIPAPARAYANPRLSPDGRTVALNAIEGSKQDIWTYDLTRNTLTRLSFEGNDNSYPLWIADGKYVIYRSLRDRQWSLFRKPTDEVSTEGGAESYGRKTESCFTERATTGGK